jgi:hypothetical protein
MASIIISVISLIVSIMSIIISYRRITRPNFLSKNSDYGEYVTNPRLKNPNDVFYEGVGPTWDVDVNGNRYHKIYDPEFITFHIDKFKGKVKPGHTIPDDL